MKKKRTKTVRKPSVLVIPGTMTFSCDDGPDIYYAGVDIRGEGTWLTAPEARRLAAWLTRFADWSDSRRGK